ncbi:MAG: YeeE/YedE thiosulfate transporter family protein [Saprospiraceae bacterium]
MNVIEFISQPWHWAVSGTALALIMFFLLWYGNRFGVSSNLKVLCTMCGAGKNVDFFKFDWKEYNWSLLFIGGSVIGGYLAANVFASPEPVQISQATQEFVAGLGIQTPQTIEEGNGFVPAEIFDLFHNFSLKNLFILIISGFLVGFGTRYANGCTSGHAISGLSNLQLPSLIAVIGFFIGGLVMTWFILPLIF